MIVRDLDGKLSNWKLNGFQATKAAKSELHLATRILLHEIYNTATILEEITVYLRKKEIVYLDFYVPLYKLAVEVQGQQHYTYNEFYHGNQQNWLMYKKRDREKALWCENNGIRLVALPYNKKNEWENLIRG